MKKIAATIAVLAVVIGALLVIGLQPRPRALAAAIEGYTGGLGISGTSYEIVNQTENEADVTVYLEIVDNGQTQRVPMENMLLQRDSAGNWWVARTTPIVMPQTPQPPNKPSNLLPSTRQTSTSVLISCVVTDNNGDRIDVFFYDNSTKNLINNVWIDNGATASRTWSGLARGQTYTFFARGQDNNGNWGENSDTRSFRVNSLPTVPTSINDLGMNLTDHTPDKRFTKGTDADGDTVYTVAFIGTLASPTEEDVGGTGTTLTLGENAFHSCYPLADGQTYYVRLRSWDRYEWSTSYTSDDQFRMNIPPTAPTNFTDLGMNQINHTPAITWTKGTDADGDTVTTYVYAGTTSTPTTVETSTTGTTANLGNTVVLNDGAICYYCLRSWDGYEWSDYTAADQFSMHAPPGTPHSPIYIQNDTYFSLEIGVNGGGSGTAGDPYIIENWAIDASGGNGIRIQNTTKYFIVRNCRVENGGSLCDGILLYNVINGRIENNTCSNNANYGINLESSSNNNLINNTCSNNGWPGINLRYSSNYNTLTGNTCEGNSGNGIKLESSSNNTITNNNCKNNHGYGITLESSSNYNTLTGNTCENHHGSGYYYYYGIYLYSSSNNTLTGNTCKGNTTHGIYLGSSSSNNLTSNTCSNNGSVGINLYSSSNNTLASNTCENNTSYGIWLYLSSNYNTLTNNTCENNTDIGIDLGFSSNYNTLTGNTCSNNIYSGIILESASSNNTIDNNNCSNNGAYGIRLYGSSNDNLTGNNCSNNTTYGIYLESSGNNIITLNHLLNNTTNNAYGSSTNAWDYNGRGNYWSDWQPPEHPDANDDGIVDEPRQITGGTSQDNYPLVVG